MDENRTEHQKVAAVAASMTMAGQPMTAETEHEVCRILRGEITVDQSALQLLEQRGLGGLCAGARASATHCRERIERVNRDGGRTGELLRNSR